MNIKNLEINKEYKNKGEVCKLLGVKKAKGGRNIKLQEQDFARYFKIEKTTGYKVKITEIYNTPKEKIDNRGKSKGSRGNNNEGIYGKYIDPILINYFQKCIKNKNHVIWETKNSLVKIVGMININYSYCNKNKYEFKQFLNKENHIKISNTALYNTFRKIKDIIQSPIISSLDRLMKKRLINYQMNYIISYNYKNRLPKIKEEQIIQNAKKTANEKFQVKCANDLKNDKKVKEYYAFMDNLVCEEIEECDGIYQGFKIIINEKILNEKVENTKELKKKLNEIVIRKVKDYLSKNHKKVIKDNTPTFGIINPNLPKWTKEIMDISYLQYCNMVIDYILNLDKYNITLLVKRIKNKLEMKNQLKKQQEQQNIKDAKELIDAGFKISNEDIPF